MVKIVERLPQSIQSRWRKLVLETLEATGRYPSIVKFTRFISETAREATDTVIGVGRSGKKDPGEQQAEPNPGTSSQQIESHTHSCSSPKQGEIKLALPIAPVKVRANGQTV